MSELVKRALTGVLIVLVLITVICSGQLGLILLVLLLSIMGLWEFYSLVETGGHRPLKITGVFSGTAITFIVSLFSHGFVDENYLVLIVPLLSIVLLVELFRMSDNPIVNAGITLLGVFYVALPFALINFLAYPPVQQESDNMAQYSPNILLGFFFLLWTNDSFAYLFGVKLGKRKLYEAVSPKKSWEGSFGGALFCLVCGYFISQYFQELQLFQWMVISALVIIFGTLGDLVQSQFKRNMKVKDSGTILPGHGGILDRFDGVLIAIPFIFVYLEFLKH
jgi:phosphatidate cytidylyltransferase